MPRLSPLIALHQHADALLIPYGPVSPGAEPVLMVAAFDPIEIEYAAIRRHAAILDQPNRSTLAVTGSDRLEFLNRMLTQELSPAKGFTPFLARSSFWLSRKGRIDADLRVLNLPDRVLLDVDVHAADRARTTLESYIITEDVQIADLSSTHHRLSIHGPGAAALLARQSTPVAGVDVATIAPNQVSIVQIADTQVIVNRHDLTGEIGLELLLPADRAQHVYELLSTPWDQRAGAPAAPTTDLARRVGWHALNIARIEAGSPVYYLDFGPDSLPHETGVLRDRVSFTKGCYLGQEVVARMESLGHPKQRVVALDIHADASSPNAPQAETGTQILAQNTDDAPVVGAVTSSCISPMLGSKPIALAMVKWSNSDPATPLFLSVASGTAHARLPATVRPTLRFLPPNP